MTARLSKSDLVADIARETNLPAAEVGSVANALIERIGAALAAGDDVAIHGFGVFRAKARAAYTARNPRTKETVEKPACKMIRFRPATAFGERVNG